MVLTIKGIKQPATTEINIEAETEFGFTVTLECGDSYRDGATIIVNNVNEYHHLAPSHDNDDHILILSDYHGTDYSPWKIFNKFKAITVEVATELTKENNLIIKPKKESTMTNLEALTLFSIYRNIKVIRMIGDNKVFGRNVKTGRLFSATLKRNEGSEKLEFLSKSQGIYVTGEDSLIVDVRSKIETRLRYSSDLTFSFNASKGIREASGTLMKGAYNHEFSKAGKSHGKAIGMVRYYDLMREDFRSFKVRTLRNVVLKTANGTQARMVGLANHIENKS